MLLTYLLTYQPSPARLYNDTSHMSVIITTVHRSLLMYGVITLLLSINCGILFTV